MYTSVVDLEIFGRGVRGNMYNISRKGRSNIPDTEMRYMNNSKYIDALKETKDSYGMLTVCVYIFL